MRIKVDGKYVEPTELDTTTTHIDVWFDRDQFKCWVITRYNKDGDQVEDSDFCAHKRDAVAFARELQKAPGPVPTLSIGKRDGSY